MAQRKFPKLLKNPFDIAAVLLSVLFTLAGSLISVNQYWQYSTFFYDFGIFDQAIWKVSQFHLPIIDHMTFGGRLIFADHFSPTIFLFSPLFWLFPHSEILLVAQATITALAGLVLYFLGKRLLKNNFAALAVTASFFLFTGLQNMIITDFHEVCLAVFFFILTYFFIETKRKKLFLLSFLLLLATKESFFLLGIGISITLWFLRKDWRKLAIATGIMSIVWAFLAIKIIIPHFSGGTYLYSLNAAINPVWMAQSFIDSPVKINTLLYSFASFGFLPVLNPLFWPLLGQDFLTRFYPSVFTTRWGLAFHYSAMTAAIMAVSSLYSIKSLQGKIKTKYLNIFLAGVILLSLGLYRFVLHGPFGLAYNSAFYSNTKNFEFLNSAVAKVPKGASIMTQNNLAPHFITTNPTYLMISDQKLFKPEFYIRKKPDYILLDNRAGQNANDFYGVQDMNLLIKNIKADKNYKISFQQGDLYIFQRSTP